MTDFISPMLAKPLPNGFDPTSGDWIAEEKLDGHRILVRVDDRPADLFGDCVTRAWSRHGRDRLLPPHIRTSINLLPNGLYDGELLVPGKRSYGTVVLDNADKLIYVIFDVLVLLDRNLTIEDVAATYAERRKFLEEIFTKCYHPNHNNDENGVLNDRGCGNPDCFNFTGNESFLPIQLGWSVQIPNMERANEIAENVWARDGEGLILKNTASLYHPGKRPKNAWYKIKQLRSSVLTVLGFRQGRMGPNSIVLLRDDEGCETTVKWKNYEELDKIEADPVSFIGRKLRIEFQERTPDGGYRHPRWDRWEDE